MADTSQYDIDGMRRAYGVLQEALQAARNSGSAIRDLQPEMLVAVQGDPAKPFHDAIQSWIDTMARVEASLGRIAETMSEETQDQVILTGTVGDIGAGLNNDAQGLPGL